MPIIGVLTEGEVKGIDPRNEIIFETISYPEEINFIVHIVSVT